MLSLHEHTRRFAEYLTSMDRAGLDLHEVKISFIEERMYMMIEYSKNMFEPKLFHMKYDYESVVEFYENIKFITSIVEEFKLNIKLWSKI